MYTTAISLALGAIITVCLADDEPVPLVIPASEYFEGNDGPWSTFDIRVGDPEQHIRVLVSTASPQAMVPLSELACSSSVFSEVPPDCAVSRGNLFNPNKSSTWIDLGEFGINQDGVGLEANLGYSLPAQWGLEQMGIGLTGPALENQTVAAFATADPFYLGIFGLNNQPVNFTVLGNHTAPSFITTLKDQGKIPSVSWSYTAGAKYRLKQVYGQLIFSGYDTSRFRENSVSFTMAEDITRDLVVSLQSISYSGADSRTILSEPIDIFIDSTDPNLWLPQEACEVFEEAFGLTLDETSGLYLVNDTHRNSLLDSDAQVSFRLSDVKAGGDTVTITLPYAAFDLTAEAPLVQSSSHYFPLKRAANATQYTLGRVFLQEAYLSADYERKVFNVSACVWNQGAEQNIVTITSKDSGSNGGSGPSSSGSLSGGTIAGIVVGAVLGALLIIGLIAIFILRKRRKWLKKGFTAAGPQTKPDVAVLSGPVFNSRAESRSTPGDAVFSPSPFGGVSAAGTRSTGTDGHTSSATAGSTPQPISAVGPIGGVGAVKNIDGGSTPELDGQDTLVRPDTELDGQEVGSTTAGAHPGVFELPGSEVRAGMNREISAVGDLPLFNKAGEAQGRNSQRTLSVSTMGTTGQGHGSASDLVSPSSDSPPQRQTWESGPPGTGTRNSAA
ncbi:aspartic peptidase domain-containing protein [Rhypophila decipiens]|uniref:Aspartic peptidase domain-containing protein n=1 Tax=Rhypophila decipiens TaxID=261697 RepID=A0AAN6YEK6_9PEZI|nr:aspartic peptidase domain-containing protein [Rhypophila decipiens]